MASGLDKSQRGMPKDNDSESDKGLGGEDCDEVKSPRNQPEDNDPDRDNEDCVEVNMGDPDWDEALEDEDCVAVRRLLEKHKKLLMRGWNSDDKSLKGQGDALEKLLNEGTEEDVKAWQKLKARLTGRTALHVAARRGDIELLEFIVSKILHVGGKCLAEYSCHVLKVVDSDYELDALAMAVAGGNPEIINFLMKASRDCEFKPYHVAAPSREPCRYREVIPNHVAAPSEEGHSNDAPSAGPSEQDPDKILKGIAEEALKKSTSLSVVKTLYDRDCDFNFNPLEISNLHLFHFTFSTWYSDKSSDSAIKPVRDEIFSLVSKHAKSEILLRYLFLDLKDGQGRTPLHVAVDSNKVKIFCNLLHDGGNGGSIDGTLIEAILNAKDAAGRTPLYRAAAKNQLVAVLALLQENGVDVNAKITYPAYQWGRCVDLDKLSWKNGFKSDCVYVPADRLRMKAFNKKDNAQGGPGPTINPLEEISATALHVAIILKHEDIVKKIVHKLLNNIKYSKDVACHRLFTRPAAVWKESTSSYALSYEMSTMKLAVLVGSIGIIQTLLEAEESKPGLFSSAKKEEEDYSAFHMAAAVGNPGIVKAFLDSNDGHFDHTVLDWSGNTSLHHALKGKYVAVRPHLVDFVGCHHVFRWRWNNDEWKSEFLAKSRDITEMRSILENNEDAEGADRYGQRMGSINLLLEAGINIWEKNKTNRTASPGPDASQEFVKWWYEKVSVETHEAQKKLNDAANAITVTAALVATASYLGPVQPPLGYADNSLQANISALRIFVVCDSLSFYLALGAIMVSLFPALPLPEESMFREQVGRRIAVAAAVALFLFPSIVFVLLAFATAYIAVIPEDGLAHHGLTVATIVVGGVSCLVAIVVFLSRLWRVFRALPIRRFFKDTFLIRKVVDLVGGKRGGKGSQDKEHLGSLGMGSRTEEKSVAKPV